MAQFVSSPHIDYMLAAKHILRYLKGNLKPYIVFHRCVGIKSLYEFLDVDLTS